MSKVREFHIAMGLPAPSTPLMERDTELTRFRMRLLREEFDESMEALINLGRAKTQEERVEAYVHLLKELADLRYVLEGAAVSFGLNIDDAFDLVHQSNMSKLDENGKPIKDAGGKVLKGPNYCPPDMTPLVPTIIDLTEEEYYEAD